LDLEGLQGLVVGHAELLRDVESGAEADGALGRDHGRHVSIRGPLENALARLQPDGCPLPGLCAEKEDLARNQDQCHVPQGVAVGSRR
jgi:hypothetical protein